MNEKTVISNDDVSSHSCEMSKMLSDSKCDSFSASVSYESSANTGSANTFQQLIQQSKLERKLSTGDLHSRLKTRKLLGVGQSDNGEIYKSKISQLLGHNDHLYVKLPKWYWCWYSVLSMIFTASGLLNLLMPRYWLQIQHERSLESKHIYYTQLYGTSLLCISAILWRFYETNDKALARSLLLITATFAAIQVSVNLFHYDGSHRNEYFIITLLTDAIIIAINGYYYRVMGIYTFSGRKASRINIVSEDISKDDTIVCGASQTSKKFE